MNGRLNMPRLSTYLWNTSSSASSLSWPYSRYRALFWSSKRQPPSVAFTKLLDSPQNRFTNPYENGYDFLLDFAADVSLDPAKVGHEIWLETTAAPGARDFNYDKPGRSELQIQLPMEQVFPFWNSENPKSESRKMRQRLQTVTGRDRTFLMR